MENHKRTSENILDESSLPPKKRRSVLRHTGNNAMQEDNGVPQTIIDLTNNSDDDGDVEFVKRIEPGDKVIDISSEEELTVDAPDPEEFEKILLNEFGFRADEMSELRVGPEEEGTQENEVHSIPDISNSGTVEDPASIGESAMSELRVGPEEEGTQENEVHSIPDISNSGTVEDPASIGESAESLAMQMKILLTRLVGETCALQMMSLLETSGLREEPEQENDQENEVEYGDETRNNEPVVQPATASAELRAESLARMKIRLTRLVGETCALQLMSLLEE